MRPWKLVLAAVAFLLGAAGVFLYFDVWRPIRRFNDMDAALKMSSEERQCLVRHVLKWPGSEHDAFLAMEHVGTAEDIPLLIRAYCRFSDCPGLCTAKHGHDALVKLTGHDAGPRPIDWRIWWEEVGSKLQTGAFPIKTVASDASPLGK